MEGHSMNHLIKRDNRWLDPFDMLSDIQGDINRLFSNSIHRGQLGEFADFVPSLELSEEDDKFVVHLDTPGMDRKDLDISVTGNTLTVKGERKSEEKKKEKGYYYSERRFGSFQRTIELPKEVDAEKIAASYKDGVLEVSLPKSERAKPKQIKVDIK